MLASSIDHIVIGANHLHIETARLENTLNSTFLGGGKHDLMATHNRLLKLQDSIYLEVIAVDPEARPKTNVSRRHRWFSLDSKITQERLARAAQPLTWVVAVSDIEAAKSKCDYDPGEIIEVSRDHLKWRLTVPTDGSLSEEGILPSLIEWPEGRNPAHLMADSGVRLKSLVVSHPEPKRISSLLEKLNFGGPLKVIRGTKSLSFHFLRTDGHIKVIEEN